MDPALGKHYLENAIWNLRQLKKQADQAANQLSDDELFRIIDPESNSAAIIMNHVSGNSRSRWTDFLTSDGEKPDRHRDSEFVVEEGTTRVAVLEKWEAGWKCLFDALEPLGSEDLARKIKIRGEEHTVVAAINRQLAHYAGHVGQIVFLAKHLCSARWKTLSIPRGQSEAFNRKMQRGTTKT